MDNRLKITDISCRKVLCIISAVLGVLGWLIAVSTSYATTTTAQSVSPQPESKECVILLHGLARTSASMNKLEDALLEQNFIVANIDYPSRKYVIEELSDSAVDAGLEQCAQQGASAGASAVHVVTHSMGGILFRQYVEDNGSQAFGRTVMLAPPNKGSEVVDALRNVPSYELLNGPAGLQLGTGSDSVPLNLGDASSDVAVIAGTFSVNLILSTYLPDPDDGKVSVESSRLDGMCAHLQVNVSHPFIMSDEAVMQEVISYLKTGKFVSEKAEYPDCDFRESS